MRLNGEIPISFTIDKEPEEWSKEGVIKHLIAKFTLVNIYDSSDYLTVPQDFNLEVPVLTTLKSGEKSDYATPMKILFNKEAVGELPVNNSNFRYTGLSDYFHNVFNFSKNKLLEIKG